MADYFEQLRTRRYRTALHVVLAAAAILMLFHLGHNGFTHWDEAYHAIVARNLTKHPLEFTLYDKPYLASDFREWWEGNHIWLHKPPIGMWQMALSRSIFGNNAFAMRLPSAIGAILAALLTFLIGKELFDRRTGIIAVFLQAFNPFVFSLVHGYQFSDHIDIALLVWTEFACWLLIKGMLTGEKSWYFYSGLAQGCAFLAKSYLALITFGIALVVLLAVQLRLFDRDKVRMTFWEIALHLLGTLVVVTPWFVYCLYNYSEVFLYEQGRILAHLVSDVESWQAPADRYLLDYLSLYFNGFYPAVILAVLVAVVTMFKPDRSTAHISALQFGELVILSWALGVLLIVSCAVSKMPSGALLALPPLLLCVSMVIGRAWNEDDIVYGAVWLGACGTIVALQGMDVLQLNRKLVDILRTVPQHVDNKILFVQQICIGLLMTAIVMLLCLLSNRTNRAIWLRTSVRTAAVIFSIWLMGNYVRAAYKVTARNVRGDIYVEAARQIRKDLPENSCLFVDDPDSGGHLFLMFYADRSAYDFSNFVQLQADAKIVRAAGGVPYIVSINGRQYPYEVVAKDSIVLMTGDTQRYTVYKLD